MANHHHHQHLGSQVSKLHHLVAPAVLLASTVSIAPATAHQSQVYFSATSSNIRCDMPGPPPKYQTRHDTRVIAREQGGIIGTQEYCDGIAPTVVSALGTGWARYTPGRNSTRVDTPLFWQRSQWRLVSKGHILVSSLERHRTATWVVLQSRASGHRLIRVNTHWVPSAWQQNGATDICSDECQHAAMLDRRADWRLDRQRTRDLVARLQRNHPNAGVVITGDLNQGDHSHPLGGLIGDYRVIYDVHPPADTEFVMHLSSPHLRRVSTSVLGCQEKFERGEPGPLYTDHSSVSAGFVLR